MTKKSINYQDYIRSEAWQKKRLKRLKMDGFRCQFRMGKLQCTATTNLEVHHLTYKNLGNERFKELITLCHKHHEQVHANKASPSKRPNPLHKQRKKTPRKPSIKNSSKH